MTSVFDIVRLQSTEVLQSRKQPRHTPEGMTVWRSRVFFWICALFPQSCISLVFWGNSGQEAGERKSVFGYYPSLWNCLLSLPYLHTAGISCSSWSKSPCWVRGCVCVSVGASCTSEPSLSPPLESDLWFLPVFLSAWGRVVNTVEHRVTLKWASSWIKRTWQEWRWRSLSLVL